MAKRRASSTKAPNAQAGPIKACTMARCKRPAVTWAMGNDYCAQHDPPGADHCSHSLAPSGRCAYCGARVSVDIT